MICILMKLLHKWSQYQHWCDATQYYYNAKHIGLTLGWCMVDSKCGFLIISDA